MLQINATSKNNAPAAASFDFISAVPRNNRIKKTFIIVVTTLNANIKSPPSAFEYRVILLLCVLNSCSVITSRFLARAFFLFRDIWGTQLAPRACFSQTPTPMLMLKSIKFLILFIYTTNAYLLYTDSTICCVLNMHHHKISSTTCYCLII